MSPKTTPSAPTARANLRFDRDLCSPACACVVLTKAESTADAGVKVSYEDQITRCDSPSVGRPSASAVSELVQASLADAEVVPDFVHQRDSHLPHDVLVAVANTQNRQPVDGDRVG